MKKAPIIFFTVTVIFLSLSVSSAFATSDLYGWMFNIDDTVIEYVDEYDTSGMPVDGTLGADDFGTLTWSWSTSTGGTHNFIAYFDYEIAEEANGYLNEYGAATGALATGQTWQIDDPNNYEDGNIYDNLYDNTLSNTNNITTAGDVAWAMGWDFDLAAGDTAVITMILGDSIPVSGFYLSQIDNDTLESIYFSGSIDIQPIPEPATMLLLGTGLAGLFGYRRKKRGVKFTTLE